VDKVCARTRALLLDGRPAPRYTRVLKVQSGFARLVANIMVMGGGALGRAFLDAYKQALQSASCARARRDRLVLPRWP
jgi:hypothetical protein